MLPIPGISRSITNLGIVSSFDPSRFRSCGAPVNLEAGGPRQRPKDDAVLLRFLPQGAQLLLRRSRGLDVELDADVLEADGRLPGDAESPAQIQVSLDGDSDSLDGDLHGRGHHLARDLGAGGQGSEEEVSRTGGGARPADTRVRLRLVDGAPD